LWAATVMNGRRDTSGTRRLATLDETVLAARVEHMLASDEPGST
jgi:hypothetical protein